MGWGFVIIKVEKNRNNRVLDTRCPVPGVNLTLLILFGIISALSGAGMIYYKGNPSIISSITGSGQIVNMN